MDHESISTVLHNTRTKTALLYFLVAKTSFLKISFTVLQYTLNVLERCKCIIEQLELRVMPDE